MQGYLAMLLALVSFWAQPVIARSWTPAEIRAMPPYCAGRYARHENPAEYRRWEAQYGPDFLHTHHLCDAIGLLDSLHRARNPAQRNTMLKDAMGHLNYMIQHAQPTFRLMSDVYLYRSRVLFLSDRKSDALIDVRKAIELDPKSTRAYVQAVDYLEQAGQRDQALALVSDGLRHLPESQTLQRLYAKFGGKPPFPEPYGHTVADGGKTSTEAQAPAQQTASGPKLAVFDLSRMLGGGRNSLREAGSYFFVELREHPGDPAGKVQLRLVSRMPQPATRVARIGIDMGAYRHLFAALQADDAQFGKYYPVQRADGVFQHAFWQGFSPTYLATFTIDAKQAKMYDPKALPPGSSLTLVATLGPGVRYEDVLAAMQEGLRSPTGVRVGIIAHHTKGYRPDPRQTIEDDGGFVTGSLRRLTGVGTAETSTGDKRVAPSGKTPDGPNAEVSAATAKPVREDTGTSAADATTPPRLGTPRNPWCRFCPDE